MNWRVKALLYSKLYSQIQLQHVQLLYDVQCSTAMMEVEHW